MVSYDGRALQKVQSMFFENLCEVSLQITPYYNNIADIHWKLGQGQNPSIEVQFEQVAPLNHKNPDGTS
jgi:hypothetical protein